jgi:hypothetical protein
LELPNSRTFAPRPYGDFALQAASRLDTAYPGFLNTSFHSSALKRQATFASFTEIDWEEPDRTAHRLRAVAPAKCGEHPDPLAQIAHALATCRAREIIRAIYDDVPDGLLGALARVGDEPLPAPYYRSLHRFFGDPHLRKKGRALRHIGRIDVQVLQVIEMVDDAELLNPAIISLLASQQNARDFARTVRWLKGLDHVDNEALDEAIRTASTRRGLGRALRHWIESAEYLADQPLFDDPAFQVLTSVSMLRAKGVEYRVCLTTADPIREAVLGLVAFVEWRPAPEELGVIVELRPLLQVGCSERRWTVASINAAANAPVPRAIRTQVEEKLLALGFFLPIRPTGDEIAACVTRLMGRLDGGWLYDLETD